MDIRIGLLGTGMIGQAHIERVNNKLQGGKVVAVFDDNTAFSEKIASKYGLKFFDTYQELIASPEVDALIVTAADRFHETYVLESIRHGKFVFCEKPLTPTSDACKRIIEAEIAGEKQLVQVGFMRRYDKGYRQIKKIIEEGSFGEPLLVHCYHRNPDTGIDFTTPMTVENSMIHEIDVLRWLLNEDYASAQMILPKKASNARDNLHDPQMLILSTVSGVHIDIENFQRTGYGYDIRCEICCDKGSITLPEPSNPVLRYQFNRMTGISPNWNERFSDAYDHELQEWMNATKEGIVAGPCAWDGYVASITTAAASKSRNNGTIEKIVIDDRPDFYRR